MKITTRIPRDCEKEFVRSVHHLSYRDVVEAQFGPWNQTKQDEFFEQKWSRTDLKILVAGGTSCGYTIVEDDGEEFRLVELVVHPEFQNRGIGSGFLKDLLERADKLETPVKLHVLLKNRAQSLYRKLGFRDIGKTDAHLLMVRLANGG